MRAKPLLIISCLIALFEGASAQGVDVIIGDWRTLRHNADVRIEDCGNGTPCGFLKSVDAHVTERSTHDERNKNPDLRTHPLSNLPIFWGYQSSQSGWTRGRLYNPETGQTFTSSLTVLTPNRLKVRGCLGPLCRAQVWTRITEPTNPTAESKPHDKS